MQRQAPKPAQRHFNPRTSCEVRLPDYVRMRHRKGISIHAPLARCDRFCNADRLRFHHFNPRTSCEVRPDCTEVVCSSMYFNPRTSCEVRPSSSPSIIGTNSFQSTHLLRGATKREVLEYSSNLISIHAPLARCDF